MDTIRIKLGQKVAKRNGGFVDPANGIAICSSRQKQGFQEVPKTAFVQARINTGELIEVKPAKAIDEPQTSLVEVTVKQKIAVDEVKYKVGDRLTVTADVAAQLREQGKVE